MSYLIMIFLPILVILIMFAINLAIDNGIISVGTCECGGKYRYFFYDTKWGKNIYKCDKCEKKIM